jgi:hypothetical protein
MEGLEIMQATHVSFTEQDISNGHYNQSLHMYATQNGLCVFLTPTKHGLFYFHIRNSEPVREEHLLSLKALVSVIQTVCCLVSQSKTDTWY